MPQADERNRVVERKEVMLFDEGAFREAIINAFLHNLWVTGNEPMFTVYEDRIEILSRGTLPPSQSIEGFFAGESIPVNAKLSEIFLQLHISEKSGRGVPKIIEFCVEPRDMQELMNYLNYKDRKTVRKYLKPLIEKGCIAMTVPEKPNSSKQKYIAIK